MPGEARASRLTAPGPAAGALRQDLDAISVWDVESAACVAMSIQRCCSLPTGGAAGASWGRAAGAAMAAQGRRGTTVGGGPGGGPPGRARLGRCCHCELQRRQAAWGAACRAARARPGGAGTVKGCLDALARARSHDSKAQAGAGRGVAGRMGGAGMPPQAKLQ